MQIRVEDAQSATINLHINPNRQYAVPLPALSDEAQYSCRDPWLPDHVERAGADRFVHYQPIGIRPSGPTSGMKSDRVHARLVVAVATPCDPPTEHVVDRHPDHAAPDN